MELIIDCPGGCGLKFNSGKMLQIALEGDY